MHKVSNTKWTIVGSAFGVAGNLLQKGHTESNKYRAPILLAVVTFSTRRQKDVLEQSLSSASAQTGMNVSNWHQVTG